MDLNKYYYINDQTDLKVFDQSDLIKILKSQQLSDIILKKMAYRVNITQIIKYQKLSNDLIEWLLTNDEFKSNEESEITYDDIMSYQNNLMNV